MSPHALLRILIAGSLGIALLAGCGSDGDGDSSTQATAAYGLFAIELNEEAINTTTGKLIAAHSTIQGEVRDGEWVEAVDWALLSEHGACRLEKPEEPFCDPDCGAGEDCSAGDVCRVIASRISVGTVTVDGLDTADGAAEVTLSSAGLKYSVSGSIDIAYPPGPVGGALQLSASGDQSVPFEVQSKVIDPLEVVTSDGMALTDPSGLELEWTPSAVAGTTLTALVDVSHHGGVRGRILCEVDDATGSLHIDPQLVSGLIDLGVSGFPVVRLTRAAVGVTELDPGHIELRVAETKEVALEIEGLVSCMVDGDCPSGQGCLEDMRCG